MAYVKTENLKFQYPNGKVISFADISIGEKQSWLLTGNSGSGKTTLLHLMAGILSPSSGTIAVANTTLNTLKPTQLDTFRAQHIGLVFQKSHFIDAINMHRNLVYFAQLSGQKIHPDYLTNLFSDLDITSLSMKKPSQLSSGELQRFSIARAMINQPSIILADEPTSSLDDDNCKRVTKLLLDIGKAYGVTLVVSTHDARLKSEFDNTIKLN